MLNTPTARSASVRGAAVASGVPRFGHEPRQPSPIPRPCRARPRASGPRRQPDRRPVHGPGRLQDGERLPRPRGRRPPPRGGGEPAQGLLALHRYGGPARGEEFAVLLQTAPDVSRRRRGANPGAWTTHSCSGKEGFVRAARDRHRDGASRGGVEEILRNAAPCTCQGGGRAASSCSSRDHTTAIKRLESRRTCSVPEHRELSGTTAILELGPGASRVEDLIRGRPERGRVQPLDFIRSRRRPASRPIGDGPRGGVPPGRILQQEHQSEPPMHWPELSGRQLVRQEPSARWPRCCATRARSGDARAGLTEAYMATWSFHRPLTAEGGASARVTTSGRVLVAELIPAPRRHPKWTIPRGRR